MKLVQEFPPHKNHWRSLHNYLQHKPNHQSVRIGYAPRFNLYGVKRDTNINNLGSLSSIRFLEDDVCNCIPPCECGWTEDNYKEAWTLSVLKDLEAQGLESDLQAGDIVVACAEPLSTSPNDKPKTDPCDCLVPHICHWNSEKYAKEPYVLSVVRLYRSYLKSSAEGLAFDCSCKAVEK